MTNATRSTRTVIEHRFEVPCGEPYGGDWKDLGVATAWAQQKAEALGIDTSCDDWSQLHVEDEALVMVVTEKRDDSAYSGHVTRTIIDVIDSVKTDEKSRDTDEYVEIILDAIDGSNR